MSAQMEKPMKTGTEITVRISLTFQDAPDVHTLFAMTPVRERGKLVRLALERYIAETTHPAGDVEQQILAISEWLRSRGKPNNSHEALSVPTARSSVHQASPPAQGGNTILPSRSPPLVEGTGHSAGTSSAINRWLQT